LIVPGASFRDSRLINTIPEYYGLVEGEARLRAIPVYEFTDGVSVSALGIGASKAIENGSLGVIQVGQSKDRLRSPTYPL
jgi:hypothetical protein